MEHTKHLSESWEGFLYMRKGFPMQICSVNLDKGQGGYLNPNREFSILFHLFLLICLFILLLEQNILSELLKYS